MIGKSGFRASFHKCNALLYDFVASTKDYWISVNKIPLGTLKPYNHYIDENGKLNIPMNEVVCIPFDPITTPLTERNAFNVLVLGGSGDGKGLLQKNAWSVLSDAGFFSCYFDPKSFDSGRAKEGWNSSKLAPFMVPKGIPLAHHVPMMSSHKIPHLIHNFRKYAMRLKSLDTRDFWIGLGMTMTAASITAKLIQGKYNGAADMYHGKKVTTLRDIKFALNYITKHHDDELPKQSKDNALRCLVNMEDFQVVSDSVKELDMWRVWTKESKAVVISLNNLIPQYLTFEVGFRIWQSYQYFFTHRNKVEFKQFKNTPIMFFLDDAKFFADNFDPKIVPFNFAVDQIIEIGVNYRSAGIYNWLSVQSLGIIDSSVAETYPIKLISPYFKKPTTLKDINIPQRAIDYLTNDVLTRRQDIHLIQWLLVDRNNEVTPFYPFTPPCQHFKEVYHPKNIAEV